MIYSKERFPNMKPLTEHLAPGCAVIVDGPIPAIVSVTADGSIKILFESEWFVVVDLPALSKEANRLASLPPLISRHGRLAPNDVQLERA